MAALLPVVQEFEHVKVDNNTFGIHKVILASSSDTVTVPKLADATTPADSVGQLDDGNNDPGVAVSASDVNTVTLIGGSAGGVVWFVTRHKGYINFGDED